MPIADWLLTVASISVSTRHSALSAQHSEIGNRQSEIGNMASPLIIGVGGLTSNVGKTTLVCDLLRAFPGWEAIKTTKGHYRSCGKDPHACCVSHLLSDEPVIRSGRAQTYEAGKDTGRYWDAGAANVHWLIASSQQIGEGIRTALERVQSPAVIVEGNSFAEYVTPNVFLMVARENQRELKPSAKRALAKVSAVFISSVQGEPASASKSEIVAPFFSGNLPVFSAPEFSDVIAFVQSKLLAAAA